MAQEVATPTQQLFIEFSAQGPNLNRSRAGVRMGMDAIARPFPAQVWEILVAK